MAIFPTSLRKLLTEKEEAAGVSWSPLNDHPKHTVFATHGRKEEGREKGEKKERGREAGREGRRKEGGKETN